MKTTFIILLTALIMGVTGNQATASEKQPLRVTIVKKSQPVVGEIKVCTNIYDEGDGPGEKTYTSYSISNYEMNNYVISNNDYVSGSEVYMTFTAPLVAGFNKVCDIKIYQDDPSQTLVRTTIMTGGGAYYQYITPFPRTISQTIDLYVEVTIRN